MHTRPLEEKKEKIVTGPGELVAAPLGKRGGPDLPVVILIIFKPFDRVFLLYLAAQL